jgi:hypothetical protein
MGGPVGESAASIGLSGAAPSGMASASASACCSVFASAPPSSAGGAGLLASGEQPFAAAKSAAVAATTREVREARQGNRADILRHQFGRHDATRRLNVLAASTPLPVY